MEHLLQRHGPDHSGRTFFILGSSGFAKEIGSYISTTLRVDISSIVFVDNTDGAISVEEYQDRINKEGQDCVSIMGSGKPDIKQKMLKEISGRVFRFVHPHAVVSDDAAIGDGVVIAPNAVVSPHATIGDHVLVNYNASVGHDSVVGDLAVISPNAAIGGWCEVGAGAYIGAGAMVRERLKIGPRSIVGMGAVITKDIPSDCVAVGNPAAVCTKEEWEAKK